MTSHPENITAGGSLWSPLPLGFRSTRPMLALLLSVEELRMFQQIFSCICLSVDNPAYQAGSSSRVLPAAAKGQAAG